MWMHQYSPQARAVGSAVIVTRRIELQTFQSYAVVIIVNYEFILGGVASEWYGDRKQVRQIRVLRSPCFIGHQSITRIN